MTKSRVIFVKEKKMDFKNSIDMLSSTVDEAVSKMKQLSVSNEMYAASYKKVRDYALKEFQKSYLKDENEYDKARCQAFREMLSIIDDSFKEVIG